MRIARGASPAACRAALRVLALVGLWLALQAPRACAETGRPGLPSYTAPTAAGCPTASQFLLEIRARTPRTWTELQASRRWFTATIVRDGAGYRGSLRVTDADGSADAREVHAASCAEVASALTLMIAVAADSQGVAATGAAPSAAGAGPWSVGVATMVSGGVAPDLAVGGALQALRRPAEPHGFTPTFGLMAAWLESAPLGGPDRTASFRWLAARGSACVPLLSLDGLAAQPCFLTELGALRGVGRHVARAKAEWAAWFSAGLALRLTAPLSDTWFLQTEGAFTVPASRPSFLFERPTVIVHQVPRVVGSVTAGLGLRIP